MRQVNLLYRQLIIIIILWQVISCSGTSHNLTTTPATLATSSTTIIKTTTVLPKVSRVNDHLMNNLTADGSIEGDSASNTVKTSNDFVFNVTNADQKTNQGLKAITNQTSDINNNSTSHNNNTNYTNDFNEDKLNTTSRRKWTEPEKIINRIKRARGRGKNQGYDATDRAKAQGKSSAFSINLKITEKPFTLYLTSTLYMLTLSITQSLPISL